VLDLGDIAFADIDLDGHPVAGQLLNRCFYHRAVAPLGHILALQFLDHALEDGLAKDLAFSKAIVAQGLHQVFGFDGLVTFKGNFGHRRPLLDRDNQHRAIASYLDIIKITGAEQGAGNVLETPVVYQIANTDRHGGKHRTGTDTLETFETNVLHLKHFSPGKGGGQTKNQ